MNPVDLMIFDFDGTLADTGEDIVQAVNYTLGTLGLDRKSYGEVVGFIGNGVRTLIERSLGPKHSDRHEEARDIFMSYYGEHLMDHTRLYPGVEEVLRYFGSKKKWIVTNKLYSFTAAIAEGLRIAEFFDGIIGRDSSPFTKPDARLLEGIADRYGIDRGKIVVVGDGVPDIQMAKNAGAWGCAFLNGLGPRDDLLRQHPDFLCESILELKTMFC